MIMRDKLYLRKEKDWHTVQLSLNHSSKSKVFVQNSGMHLAYDEWLA